MLFRATWRRTSVRLAAEKEPEDSPGQKRYGVFHGRGQAGQGKELGTGWYEEFWEALGHRDFSQLPSTWPWVD